MTLVLMLAEENQVHMTCDFKLTDARSGKSMSVDAHKLVPVGVGSLQAVVGVTGLATLDGEAIGNWIANRTSKLGFDADWDRLVAVLREASDALARVPVNERRFRHLTFAIGAIQGSQAVVALLSNYQNLRGHYLADGATPGSDLRLDMARPAGARLVTAGQVRAVRKEERKALEYLVRSGGAPDAIRERMAALNRKAASRTTYVSEGCYAASELATGNGETQPFLVEQTGDFIPPDLERMLADAGLKLNPKILPDGSRAPIQIRAATSMRYNPSPLFFREQFKLRPDDSELWNNFGAYEVENGRVDAGRTAYARALALDPKNYMAAQNLGSLLWRTDGEREAGREYIDVALENPDENHRRETLSQLGDSLLFTDGDVQAAGQAYEESIRGEPLPAVNARWAYYILHYEPSRRAEAEVVITDLAQREPHYALATAVRAEFLWIVHGDVPAARTLVQNLLGQFPKDNLLLAASLHLSLVDGDIDDAEKLLRGLARREGSTSRLVLSYSALVGACRGRQLVEIEEAFRHAGGDDNAINTGALLWAQARDEEARTILESIEQAKVSVDARTEARIVLGLASSSTPEEAASSVAVNDEIPFWDQTILRALSNHPELPGERKSVAERYLNALVPGAVI